MKRLWLLCWVKMYLENVSVEGDIRRPISIKSNLVTSHAGVGRATIFKLQETKILHVLMIATNICLLVHCTLQFSPEHMIAQRSKQKNDARVGTSNATVHWLLQFGPSPW